MRLPCSRNWSKSVLFSGESAHPPGAEATNHEILPWQGSIIPLSTTDWDNDRIEVTVGMPDQLMFN
jgi:hypothetical protein